MCDMAEALVFNPLLLRLMTLFRSSVHTCIDSYISPPCWTICRSLVEQDTGHEFDRNFTTREQLANRNTALLRPLGIASPASNDTPRQTIIHALDGSFGSCDIKTISRLCRDVVKNPAILINTVLEWSSTSFRLNKNRLFLGVRLLRSWKDEGIEIDSLILQFIGSSCTMPKMEADSICRLVLELIRSRHFSTSKYLHWLLAMEPLLSGCPQDKATLPRRHESFQSRSEHMIGLPFLILSNIPLEGLPKHTLNLRQTLLERHGYSVREETKEIGLVRETIQQVLSITNHRNDSTSMDFHALERFRMEHRSVSAMASQLIRFAVLARRRHQVYVRDLQSPLFGILEFEMMRRFFENHDEFAVFADVMKVAAKFCEQQLLYDVTFVLNWHLDVFRALGVAECIFRNLHARAENMGTHRLDDLPFLFLLSDLSERLPSQQNDIHLLRHLIRQCNPLPPVAACSPVTDPDTELLDGSDATFLEEMDMVLTSGNSIDRPTLSRLFSFVIARVEKEWTNYSRPLGPLFDLLNRLRQFDEEALDALLHAWLKSVATPAICQDLPRIVVPLVCSAMITLSSIMDLIIVNIRTLGGGPDSCELARQTLSLLMVSTEHADVTKYLGATLAFQTFRWATEKNGLLRTVTPTLSILIRNVLENGAHGQRHGQCKTCALISESSFIELMHTSIIFQPAVRGVLEEYLSSDILHGAMDQVFEDFLGLKVSFFDNNSGSSDPSIPTIGSRIKRLLEVADDFNIAFARLNLIVLLRQLKSSSESNEQLAVMAMLTSMVLTSNDAKHHLMLQLLPLLGSAHALEASNLVQAYASDANHQ